MSNAINQVLRRIQEIERKFSLKPMGDGVSFQDTLNAKLQSQRNGVLTAAKAAAKDQLPAAAQPAVSQSNQLGQSAVLKQDDSISNMVAAAAHKYGVDQRLAMAVAQTESNYEPTAVSEAGAVGVMQLMPDTAASLGVTNIYDPRDNIEGGVKYLKQLLNGFGGDVTKAVAAYNAGPQAVKDYGGVPPYAETKNYVEKVLDLYS